MKIETIISNVSSDEQAIEIINSQISSINASLGEIQSAIGDLKSTTNSLSSSNSSLNTKVTNHINNKSNPHTVTKSQIGLGNVRNLAIYMGQLLIRRLVRKILNIMMSKAESPRTERVIIMLPATIIPYTEQLV